MLTEYVATFDNNNILTFTVFCTDYTTDIVHFQLMLVGDTHFHDFYWNFWIKVRFSLFKIRTKLYGKIKTQTNC